jgi:hypothetical protein
MTPDSVLSFEQAIECYRVITGACAAGVKHFIEASRPKPKKQYTIREIIEITEGQYGSETFKQFFNK